MIPLVLVAIGAAAATTGIAAGRWMYRRVRRAAPKAPQPRDDDAGLPLGLGDVLILDQGRGVELWIARSASLSESGNEPFIVLLEAIGPQGHQAVVVLDPLAVGKVDVLSPQLLEQAAVLGGVRSSRPPDVAEGKIDGVITAMKLERRRTVIASLVVVDSATGKSALPPAGKALLVATYGGGNHGRALVVRDDEGLVHSYVGQTISLSNASVLRNRAP